MIDVVELFAGVGGFRLGLERNEGFNIVWGNQWEPSKKVQYAFDCYAERFKSGTHSNEDIAKVKNTVPNHDLLVGGFPCQDYSVARSISGETGIEGKKGVLFWEIMDIVNLRNPTFVLLENVDRLLKSPAKQRGRDFAIMLASFRDAGYTVEWRVINAADYGFAQKRRRVFIFAYREVSNYARKLENYSSLEILHDEGFFVSEFPIKGTSIKHPASSEVLPLDIVDISDNYSANFMNAGVMKKGKYYTEQIIPEMVPAKTLGTVLEEARQYQTVDEKYYLNEEEVGKNGKTTLEMYEYMKGPKKVPRTSNTGHVYTYAEGGMNFPDDLSSPARTMLTSEGTKNRSTHIVRDLDTNRLRILTPVECELINDFPANWTEGMPDKARYFCMGNALVVGLIEKMGKKIKELYVDEVTSIEEKYNFRVSELEEEKDALLLEIVELKKNPNFSLN
ncbi:DNA (cytosine-5-)-methyltransferase [Peribacillus sp. SI8-4]|uniref:DNA (cytosine-5-)-methyltransferase n=1 Tax=Peribacillus sp. SI8-4 TaxID=3048009 RepID=UPI002552B45D|nr:DNA (cytosine-5-)-methyltransferase [Peribacillus sp. SI8-4]